MRYLSMVILLLLALVSTVYAGVVGMVTQLTPGGEVVVNRGVNDNITPGTRWYIYRDSKPLAELEVVLVDDFTSNARIVSGSDVRVGDKVTDKVFATAPQAAPEARKTVESDIPKNQPSQRFGPPPAKPETADSTQKTYEKMLAANSKSKGFSGGGAELRKTTVDVFSVYNVFSGPVKGQPMVWQDAVSVLPHEVMHNMANKKLYKNCSLNVSLTWWSEDLLDAFSDMMAFREGRTSTEQRLAMRNGLYSQKGLDRFLVFHVKLRNEGPGVVQVNPFHWHMYLLDSQGNKVKAERYDQVLDRSLNPEQEVEGNVYFLKIDASGREVTQGRHCTVLLEDILAEQAQVKF